jgi:hypothetical protein
MKKILLTILPFFLVFAARAQQSYEVGLFIGGSYYIGDLNPMGHFNNLTQPAAGGIFRYNFNPRFSARANGFYGTIKGDDASTRSFAQQQRNLHFKSTIMEFSAIGEFNFLEYKLGSNKHPFTSYLFAGVGVFKHAPRALLNGNWIDLQPLGTEGQGTPLSDKKKYKLTQLCIPFGIGVKTNLAKRIGLSIEWGMRKTFTDYLDDVSGRYVNPYALATFNGPAAGILSDRSLVRDSFSNIGRQRGNPTTKDWYSFTGFILSFKLKDKADKCPFYR